MLREINIQTFIFAKHIIIDMAGIAEAITKAVRSGRFIKYTEDGGITKIIGVLRRGFSTSGNRPKDLIKLLESNGFEYLGEQNDRYIFRTTTKPKYKTLKEVCDSL